MTINVTNAERDAIKFFINQATLLIHQTKDTERIIEINSCTKHLENIVNKFEIRKDACKNAYLVNKEIIKKYKESHDSV